MLFQAYLDELLGQSKALFVGFLALAERARSPKAPEAHVLEYFVEDTACLHRRRDIRVRRHGLEQLVGGFERGGVLAVQQDIVQYLYDWVAPRKLRNKDG